MTERGLQALPARAGIAQVNVGEGERSLSVLAGAALVLAGLARRGFPGAAAGAAGAFLVARGATGRCAVYGALGRSTAVPAPRRTPIEVARAVTIGKGIDEIRDALRRPEAWLAGGVVESVAGGDDRFTLTLRALGLTMRDLEVEVRGDAVDTLHLFARHGEGRQHEGRITLCAAPGAQGTEVRAAICIVPAGAFGAALARSLEGIAERALGHALGRLRQLLESGETARADAQPHAQRSLLVRTVRKVASRREAAA